MLGNQSTEIISILGRLVKTNLQKQEKNGQKKIRAFISYFYMI